ncbi:hypothetical protein M0802_002111 [Mischocyttarus mexicanus]|nr:hypothetical protein M0802_002111 [Mischocyttarus mexicanus]
MLLHSSPTPPPTYFSPTPSPPPPPPISPSALPLLLDLVISRSFLSEDFREITSSPLAGNSLKSLQPRPVCP